MMAPPAHSVTRHEPLPIDSHLEEITALVARSRAAVIVAAPGAGKTTRVPPALLSHGRAIVLQPRRAAARSIARRIAAERGWTEGREVGWHVRFERRFSADTALLFATEGILTARLQSDPFLTDFATIVLDEFHERSIHADVAIALAKQAMLAREDLRLVVMSATIDAERVSAYLDGCPVVRVPARTHPLRIEYCPTVPTAVAANAAYREAGGNVLCFEPGAAEIARTVSALRALLPDEVDVLPLHGGLAPPEQDRVLAPGRAPRIIVATNIAETSVTVPGVTAVIDTGLEKVARYDQRRAIDSLTLERISAASADQRAGRAARLGPGVAWRLWEPSLRLQPYRLPDIQRIDLAGVALDILAWGGDPRTLDWFEPPRKAELEAALELLQRLGATRGGTLTAAGRAMVRLPLPPRLARIALEGGGQLRVLQAVALLAEDDVPRTPVHATPCDLLPALDSWHLTTDRTRRVLQQLQREFQTQDAGPPAPGAHDEQALRVALLAGYPDRVAQRRGPNDARFLLTTGTGAVLAPESGVRNADLIVALDVRTANSGSGHEGRIRLASAVNREWLTDTTGEIEHILDGEGVVRARRVVRYGALRLAEHPTKPEPEQTASILVSAWFTRPMSEADAQLLRRLEFAGMPGDPRELVRAAVAGARALSDIVLSSALSREQRSALDRHAPGELTVPSGRQIRLDYQADGTVMAAVKLQELFGLADTPRLGPRREPVLLSLLAPNGRPVQLTRDLKSFWDRTYPEVRKELRGRYPKHPWPDDPWAATPTHRTKPRPRS